MAIQKNVAIIGGGASSLALASELDTSKYSVTIYERNKALGRKFLVAGKGGFNLTHSEPIVDLKSRYSPAGWLDAALDDFDNVNFRTWLDKVGIPTYVGSSKRVFPVKGIKPIEVLRAIEQYIISKGVEFHFESQWLGWTADGKLQFEENVIDADIVVFALGGGSWSVTGSDGAWLDTFRKRGTEVVSFAPANCRYLVEWAEEFRIQCEGKPLKNIAITCGSHTSRGEAMVTSDGIEGSCIYALTDPISKSLESGDTVIHLDLKPTLSREEILKRLLQSDRNMTIRLSKSVKLDKTQLRLIKAYTKKEEYMDPDLMATKIKELPIRIEGTASIDDAISTMGGLGLAAVDEYYQLHKHPNTFCIGEMLDWNAPTGGYLLQGCFSMGMRLARHLNDVR